MSRPTYAGVLLALATLLPGMGFAQPSAKGGAAPAARVQHLIVRGTGDAIEVEIQTSGATITPDTQAITGPDRIVIDFPGALPAEDLHALKVNRGALKGVRSGLFFNDPPITRVVLDLNEPQSYQVSTKDHSVIVKLGGPKTTSIAVGSGMTVEIQRTPVAPGTRLQNAAVASGVTPKLANAVSEGVLDTTVAPQAAAEPPQPAKPPLTVTFAEGLLHIHSDKATLAQVLFEVQRQTHAEIAIPAGAEQEEVFTDLGPAPSRDVLALLLNGTPYNFIFVGTEQHLEQVILSRRDSNPF
jgi:hypothetical protein